MKKDCTEWGKTIWVREFEWVPQLKKYVAEIILSKPEERWIILERDNFTCQICGATPTDSSQLHVDHIIPKSKGGSNMPSNLQTLCASCNLKKGSKVENELNKIGNNDKFQDVEK